MCFFVYYYYHRRLSFPVFFKNNFPFEKVGNPVKFNVKLLGGKKIKIAKVKRKHGFVVLRENIFDVFLVLDEVFPDRSRFPGISACGVEERPSVLHRGIW